MNDRNMPRSIEKLTKLWNELMASEAVRLAGTADALRALIDEAAPHELGNRIESTGSVIVNDDGCLMSVHLRTPPGKDPEHRQHSGSGGTAQVHPAIAAIHSTSAVISALNGALQTRDRNGDWPKAATIANAMIEVLNRGAEAGTGGTAEVADIEYGRLPTALPDVCQKLVTALTEYRTRAQEDAQLLAIKTHAR